MPDDQASAPGNTKITSRAKLNHRRMDVTWLASASGISEIELRSVVLGVPPLASQLGGLAPALGFQADDLYVIADVPVPEARMPWDPAAGSGIASLVKITMALPSDHRARVHWMVDQLPHEPRDPPSLLPQTYDQHESGFGAMLANLLCGNRNLHSLTAAAKTLALLTDGRVYLAASTISGIGRKRVPLTPDLVTGFTTAPGISAGDLAVITGVSSPNRRGPTIRWRPRWRSCFRTAGA